MILSGDFNARVGKLSDYIQLDEYLSEMFDFDDELTNFFDKTTILENLNIPLQRSARDIKTNTSGYWLIDMCKNNNLFITNGRVGKDKGVGHKTFRGTSTIDYTVCTANCFEFLTQFEVIDLDPIFSDGHALLSWSFKTNKDSYPTQGTNQDATVYKCRWSEKNADLFIQGIDMQEVQLLHEKLDTGSGTPDNIYGLTENISRIFKKASSQAFGSTRSHFVRRKFDKPWFGPACKIARKKYHRARNIYYFNKNSQNKETLHFYSKQYKFTMNKFIHKYRKNKINKLRTMQTKNPKDYWKYIKSLDKSTSKNYPPLNSLYEHFKNINKSKEPHESYETSDSSENETLNKRISVEEICKCIKKLKNG